MPAFTFFSASLCVLSELLYSTTSKRVGDRQTERERAGREGVRGGKGAHFLTEKFPCSLLNT